MEARAYLRNVRIAPRKVQIVLDLIRGKDTEYAGCTQAHIKKLLVNLSISLKSAIANAENNHDMDRNNLYVAECFVCQDLR